MNEKEIISQIRNLKEEDVEKYIIDRLNFLEENSGEKRESISMFEKITRKINGAENVEVNGFISKNTRVKMAGTSDGFKLDDYNYYNELVRVIRQADDNRVTNNNFIMDAIQRRIMIYLGMGASEEKRENIFNSSFENGTFEDISIKDFKGKNAAMCVERSAMGQNMLAFLGYDPMMVYGRYSDEKGANIGHAYNCIFRSKSSMLIDFSNPTYGVVDGKLSYLKPSVYKIDLDQTNDLKKGDAVIEVDHVDYNIEDGNKTLVHNRIIYSSDVIEPSLIMNNNSELENLNIELNSLQNDKKLKEKMLEDDKTKDKDSRGVEL